MMQYVGIGEHLIFAALGFASILALAVTIEKGIIFRRNSSKSSSRFISEFSEILRSHDIDKAGEYVENSSAGIYTEFAGFAMKYYKKGHKGLSELLQGKIIEKKVFLEKRLSILNTLGNNAPFIGLLGTVLGVIKAFYNLGLMGDTGTELVMKSISTALLATAAGLFVAIPVVMANNYFSKNVRIIIHNMEIISMEFMASMVHNKSVK
jgi:biopolymer transport protein ExbB